MKATIWHNPRCSKSRETLAILNEAPGVEVEIIDYLKHPPTRMRLADLVPARAAADGDAEPLVAVLRVRHLDVALRVRDVPQRIARRHARDLGEVVLGRRRRDRPLERPRLPRIVARDRARRPAAPEVPEADRDADDEDRRADRRGQVEARVALAGVVRVDAARHA